MFRKQFALATLERAIKTAAQAVVLVLGGYAITDLDSLVSIASASGYAAIGGFSLSVVTSLASADFGTWQGPSLTSEAVLESKASAEE